MTTGRPQATSGVSAGVDPRRPHGERKAPCSPLQRGTHCRPVLRERELSDQRHGRPWCLMDNMRWEVSHMRKFLVLIAVIVGLTSAPGLARADFFITTPLSGAGENPATP